MKKTVSLIMMFVIALTAFTGCQKSQGGNGDGRQKFSQMIIGQEDLFSTVISQIIIIKTIIQRWYGSYSIESLA